MEAQLIRTKGYQKNTTSIVAIGDTRLRRDNQTHHDIVRPAHIRAPPLRAIKQRGLRCGYRWPTEDDGGGGFHLRLNHQNCADTPLSTTRSISTFSNAGLSTPLNTASPKAKLPGRKKTRNPIASDSRVMRIKENLRRIALTYPREKPKATRP